MAYCWACQEDQPHPFGMLKMAGSTPEFATIVRLSSDLRLAVQDDLLDLSLRLQGCQPPILNQDNAAEVTNTMVAAPERAVKLVGYITNRVQGDPGCYHALIKVLETKTNALYYKHILGQLSETFASLKRQEGTSVAECAEVCSTGACGGTSTREVGKENSGGFICVNAYERSRVTKAHIGDPLLSGV